jgi:hypothetical protein
MNIDFKSCSGQVKWNDYVVQSLNPCDYSVNTASIYVNAKIGENNIKFEGTGVSDSYGLTIDNVRLVKYGTNINIVTNGDFEIPCQSGKWSIYDNILGWAGHSIEVGAGSIYNHRWNSQVVELDGNSNSAMTQNFYFDSAYNPVFVLIYNLEFDWAPRTNGICNLQSSQGIVRWNNQIVANLKPTCSDIQHISARVIINVGDNSL